jgi:ABC-type nickel/cobalt efflux system permease component RcnA
LAPGLQVNAWSNQLESISYAMIALVGLYLVTGQLRGVWRRWQQDAPVTVVAARDIHGLSDHHHHTRHDDHNHESHEHHDH